ncbi:MAG: YraN family protein [bacterium]|nr:YraN family protein [bacterium]
MRPSTLILGKIGEEYATNCLEKIGYGIVERNFRLRNGEIDIVAIDQKEKPPTLVFVEVKTREGNAYGTPLEAITYYKLKFLIRTAMVYSTMHPRLPKALRIDAIAVSVGPNNELLDIEHVKNISQ